MDFEPDTAVVPECFESTLDDTNGKEQYTFQIRCVSEWPEIAREVSITTTEYFLHTVFNFIKITSYGY